MCGFRGGGGGETNAGVCHPEPVLVALGLVAPLWRQSDLNEHRYSGRRDFPHRRTEVLVAFYLDSGDTGTLFDHADCGLESYFGILVFFLSFFFLSFLSISEERVK